MKTHFLYLSVVLIFFTSCVSKKDYDLMELSRNDYMRKAQANDVDLERCVETQEALKRQIERLQVAGQVYDESISDYEVKIGDLQKEITRLETSNSGLSENNKQLLNQLESLSIINQQGAENIKKSLETLNQQSNYIKNLNNRIQNRDSVNLLLAQTIKRSLSDVNDQDINVDVEGGVVFISISDKMLFDLGKYNLKPEANAVLAKIGSIANDHSNLDILVEGHTDNVPVKSGSFIQDNWDLSALRATAVVRSLQEKYNVAPDRLTAGARSEYIPKATNDTAQGRALNRRTKIYLLPKLDQYFKLVEESISSN